MKALFCTAFGPPENLELLKVDDLVPAENEAVVDVYVAAVNFPDALMIQNLYQVKPDLPFSPGAECAGVVRSVGSKVRNVKPGDRVIALTGGWGAMAEQVRVNSMALVPMLPDLDFEMAAAFVMTYATSYHALKDRGALTKGETLVVLGASGGVGLAAIEIGKKLGARVIAAASSEEKLAVCCEHGADETINYSTADLKQSILELTNGKGADVIYDPIGDRYAEPALRAIAWRGRYLVVGFAAGNIPALPFNLMLLKGCDVVGVHWGGLAKKEPMQLMMDIRTLFGWLVEGALKPHIAARYSLAEGGAAIRALMDRRVSGKVVVTIRES